MYFFPYCRGEKMAHQKKHLLSRFCGLPAKSSYKMCVFQLVVSNIPYWTNPSCYFALDKCKKYSPAQIKHECLSSGTTQINAFATGDLTIISSITLLIYKPWESISHAVLRGSSLVTTHEVISEDLPQVMMSWHKSMHAHVSHLKRQRNRRSANCGLGTAFFSCMKIMKISYW